MANLITLFAIAGLVLVTAAVRSSRSKFLVLAAHNIPWAVALIIWMSGLIRYNPVSLSGLLILVAGIGSFNLGALVGPKDYHSHHRTDRTVLIGRLLTRRTYLALWVAYCIGLAWYLITINRLFGVGTLLSNPASIRSYSAINYIEAFPLAGRLLFYLAPLLMVLTLNPGFIAGPGKMSRALRIGMLIFLVITQLASLQRTNLFVGIVWSITVFVVAPAPAQPSSDRLPTPENSHRLRSRRRRRGAVRIAAACITAIAVFQLLGGALGKTYSTDPRFSPYLTSSLSRGPAGTLLIYGSSGVAAFLDLTQSRNHNWPPNETPPIVGDYNPLTLGAATFSTVAKAIPLFKPWPEIDPFVNVPIPTNVYTWLDPWYRDFRAPGVLLFAFLAGFAASALLRMRTDTVRARLIGGLALSVLVWAPFTNRVFSTMTVELAIVVLAITPRLRPQAWTQKLGLHPDLRAPARR